MEKKTNIIYPIFKYSIFLFGIIWVMYSLTIDLKKDREAYEQTPIYKSNPLTKGALLYKNGEEEMASQIFDKILKSDPNNYETRIMLAEIFHNQCIKNDTNCEQALWQLTYLIEKFPLQKRPLEMRSKLHLKLHDTIASRNDLIKISKLK